jgi:pimeloyl-ACP methyl ester carboxylesterase
MRFISPIGHAAGKPAFHCRVLRAGRIEGARRHDPGDVLFGDNPGDAEAYPFNDAASPESTAVGAMEAMQDPAIWKDNVFTQPVMGVYADRASWPVENDMKKRFPNSELHKTPGTGHLLMMEKPEEFNRLLKAFLGKQSF